VKMFRKKDFCKVLASEVWSHLDRDAQHSLLHLKCTFMLFISHFGFNNSFISVSNQVSTLIPLTVSRETIPLAYMILLGR
jgi:hypothetical protein